MLRIRVKKAWGLAFSWDWIEGMLWGGGEDYRQTSNNGNRTSGITGIVVEV